MSDTDQAAAERSTTQSTFVIERTYPASPARVWSAWADPKQKLAWFGPKELKGEHELEFRVGGHERMSVRTPDGVLYLFDSEFRDIVEHARIVHTYEMYRDERRISVSVATIELEPAGDATMLTLTEHGVYLDGLDTAAEREHGTREMLSALGAALQKLIENLMSTLQEDRPLAPAPHEDRSRWVALYVLCVGMLMIVLDVTIVNVALPSIQTDLRFTTSSLAWVVNAYLIAFGGLLLLAGRFGDLIGRRRIFLAGVGLFTVASLACGLAGSQSLLIAARFVQGIGGAMTSAVILGMIVTMFPEPREQAKAIGVYAFVASAGGSVGLLAGGVITQSIDWHWIFFVNIPIGIATAVAARRLLEHDAGIGFAEGADIPGALLITSSLMLGVYTIVKPAAEDGWGSGRALALGGVSLALLLGFLAREATASKPLVPLRIFRSRNVATANLIQVLSVAGMFGVFFLGALYLRRVLGYDALEIGLAFLPVSVTMGTLSIRYSEQLVTRFGARNMLIPGLALIGLALVLFAQAPVHGSYVAHVLPSMLLLGIGAGVCFPALMNVAMSGAAPQDAGLASGLVNTTAQVGGALGLAVLATLSTSRSSHLIAQGHATNAALTSGYHLAFWIAAALVAAAIAVVPLVARDGAADLAAAGGSVARAHD